MNHDLGAVIMVGQGGASAAERLVQRAVQASALDLIDALAAGGVAPIVVAGPALDWLPDDAPVVRDLDRAPFAFGPRLAEIVERVGVRSMLYFGGGSTPLLPRAEVARLAEALRAARDGRVAITNNLHSSDWLGLTDAQAVRPTLRAAPRDNSLAWMLQQERGYAVQIWQGPSAASGLDLDTPADLALTRAHPLCTDRLRAVLGDPLLDRIPVEALVAIAARDGSRLALIGRVAPGPWQALSRAGQSWIRAFSEERGMVASERLARGEVRSLIGRLLALLGPVGFFRELADVCDAAVLDTRVLMAAAGHYAPDADRFASDLLLPDAIADPWLRAFTQAAADSPIPLLLGGHGAVSGGLYVLADGVAARRAGR